MFERVFNRLGHGSVVEKKIEEEEEEEEEEMKKKKKNQRKVAFFSLHSLNSPLLHPSRNVLNRISDLKLFKTPVCNECSLSINHSFFPISVPTHHSHSSLSKASEALLSPQSNAKVTKRAVFGKQDDELVHQQSDG